MELSRPTKRLIALIVDASTCVLSFWIALYLRLDEFVYFDSQYFSALIIALVISLPIFVICGLYRAIFRYSSWAALLTVTKAVMIYAVIYSIIITLVGTMPFPKTIVILQPIIFLILISASRFTAYFWLGEEYHRRIGSLAKERILIYGAGAAGRQIAAALSMSSEVKAVGFLDDDLKLTGQVINGLTVYLPNKLKKDSKQLGVTSVLIALPSVSRKRRQEIINDVIAARLNVRTLPSVTDIAQGKVTISDIRELSIDDLLGRAVIDTDKTILQNSIENRIVMVTGAGGSIGRELCRQIIFFKPARLILIDHSEFALYEIHQELLLICNRIELNSTNLQPILASVQNSITLEEVFKNYLPEIVYHAAAYKHVPLVEMNPHEGILNNVFGTKVTAELAFKYGVKLFVLVSTDKAVRPSSLMGAAKRLAELIVQDLAAEAVKQNRIQIFCAVRFGNVIGSSGSVIPLFSDQIAKGGPISLTHLETTRFFMSVNEAVGLILHAGYLSEGGEIFILDMGSPIKIIDLAKKMANLNGYSIKDELNPKGEIEIVVTGLRPGEKIYEELLINSESSTRTAHTKIFKAREPRIESVNLNVLLTELRGYLDNGQIRAAIDKLMDNTRG